MSPATVLTITLCLLLQALLRRRELGTQEGELGGAFCLESFSCFALLMLAQLHDYLGCVHNCVLQSFATSTLCVVCSWKWRWTFPPTLIQKPKASVRSWFPSSTLALQLEVAVDLPTYVDIH